jgi:hypothetical protein
LEEVVAQFERILFQRNRLILRGVTDCHLADKRTNLPAPALSPSVKGVVAMADHPTLSFKGPRDHTRIDLREDYEVRYWCKKLGVTPDVLRAVVEKVGDSVDAVENEIRG